MKNMKKAYFILYFAKWINFSLLIRGIWLLGSSFITHFLISGARSISVQPEGMGRVYERGKAPAPPPPVTSQQSLSSPHPPPNGLINGPPSDVSSKPKAVVVYNYVKKDNQEMSLGKSQIVTVLDSKKGSEWWKVQDSIGRQGFYPSHYLKMI